LVPAPKSGSPSAPAKVRSTQRMVTAPRLTVASTGSRAASTDISPMAVSLPASPGSDGGHPKSPSAGPAAAVWISPSAAAADPARARLARTRMAAVRNVSGARAPSGGTTRERLHSLFLVGFTPLQLMFACMTWHAAVLMCRLACAAIQQLRHQQKQRHTA